MGIGRTLTLCHGGLQLVRSLQNDDLVDYGPISLMKVFQFLQISVASLYMRM